jgi:uncharacterized protein YegJ (DUF2314 family)
MRGVIAKHPGIIKEIHEGETVESTAEEVSE